MAKAGVFSKRLKALIDQQSRLLKRRNAMDTTWSNGLFDRYKNPIVTAGHIPLDWRYDLNEQDNPYLMERLGINAVFNAGAMEFEGRIALVCRVEGVDRKSFFAVAESKNGIDGFTFWDEPVTLPPTRDPDINVYDMRLTRHADGWIYGIFCTERKDPTVPPGDTSSAIAQCGIARTKDLRRWERLADLKSNSAQQRNVVLHPEFIQGKYAFYTRPQDNFMEVGKGGGIGWALADSIEQAVIREENIIDPKAYHTIKEAKNGAGAPPIKTKQGWLHIAHGVRNTAAGLRYVLYAFLCDLQHPEQVIRQPGGYFIAPHESERVGDVSNVVFCNGVVARSNGRVFVYYASSDTRMHVATTTVDKLLDYVHNTSEDPLRTDLCVAQRNNMIAKNRRLFAGTRNALLKKACC